MGSSLAVASSVYNLAGDINKRPNYLKTTLLGAVYNSRNISETITKNYSTGPGIKLRSFAKWARTKGYSLRVGMTEGGFSSVDNINTGVIETQLPDYVDTDNPTWEYKVEVQKAEIGPANFMRWAEQFMLLHLGASALDPWTADYDSVANLITINYFPGSPTIFTPYDLDPTKQYLYVTYNYYREDIKGTVVRGETIVGEFPTYTNEVVLQNEVTPKTWNMTGSIQTYVNYSDGRAGTFTNDPWASTVTVEDFYKVVGVSAPLGGDKYHDKTYFMSQISEVQTVDPPIYTKTEEVIGADPVSGVPIVKTTEVYQYIQKIGYYRGYRVDENDRVIGTKKPSQLFIYKRNSGMSLLDTQFLPGTSAGAFFPYIPLRLDNNFVSKTFYPDLYIQAKKALRKAVGGSFDSIIKTLDKNPQIGDIDFAYIVFGVPLNTKEKESKIYVYDFLTRCLNQTSTSGLSYPEWEAYNRARIQKIQLLNQMLLNQRLADLDLASQVEGQIIAWNYDTQRWESIPKPVIPPYISPPNYSMTLNSDGHSEMNYSIRIEWVGMKLSPGYGASKPNVKEGEIWFDILPDLEYQVETTIAETQQDYPGQTFITYEYLNQIRVYHQINYYYWEQIDIIGMVHKNFVYQGKPVEITARKAIENVEESGFIIPLQEDIYKSYGLIPRTQMATSCAYLVLNSYQIVKRKWYQTSLFQIVLFIVVIVVSVAFPPLGGAAGAGLLGTDAAVGAAITGLAASTLTAVIVGAVANALASMILISLIQGGATAIFGSKVGSIIAFIASVFAVKIGSLMLSNQQVTMASLFGGMMKAENLMKLTFAGADGISKYLQACAQETVEETKELMENYAQQSKDLTEKYQSEFGIGAGGVFDPSWVTDPTNIESESLETFLGRTLMTGTDIAELSLSMIGDFARLTTNLEFDI